MRVNRNQLETTTMKINVNIETTDPADLIRVANALAGVMPDPSTGEAAKPAKPRQTKTESPSSSAGAVAGPEAASTGSAGTAAHSNTQNANGAGATSAQTALTGAAGDVTVTEADLVAAANAAVAKLGPSGPGKVKEWIGQNFQKADGSAGTLKLTREDQRPALLKALQEIGQGVKAI